MSTHPLPLDGTDQPLAMFVCVECEHIFAGRMPPICVDLPLCPLCSEESWVYDVVGAGLVRQNQNDDDDYGAQPQHFG